MPTWVYIHVNYYRHPFCLFFFIIVYIQFIISQISKQQIRKPSVSLSMSVSELQSESDARLITNLPYIWDSADDDVASNSSFQLVLLLKSQHVFAQDNLAAGVTFNISEYGDVQAL